MDPEMFEDDIVNADALEAWGEHCDPHIPNNDKAQESAAAEKIHNDRQHYEEGYDPQWDLYHDRYDDDPNPYHGTYSEE